MTIAFQTQKTESDRIRGWRSLPIGLKWHFDLERDGGFRE
ncbi:hypothetical protein CKA32_004375 [Geitlerinema sp. FC II]|nr:hypothetical protein CKA32_004375 [Geitlerinema sp. FC II]